jgi:hypothetical protein
MLQEKFVSFELKVLLSVRAMTKYSLEDREMLQAKYL